VQSGELLCYKEKLLKIPDLISSRSEHLALWLEAEVRVCVRSVPDYFNVRVVAVKCEGMIFFSPCPYCSL